MNKNFFSNPVIVKNKIVDDNFIVDFTNFDSIIIRPFDIEKDLPVIYEWFNMDYSKLWGMQGLSFEKVREIYERVCASESDNAYIAELSSTNQYLALFHYYDPQKHDIGNYYQALDSDKSTHRIFAPVGKKIPNLTWYVFRAISEFCFNDPSVKRIVDEPNVYNLKYFAACKQAGYHFGKLIHMPSKTAQLTILTRENFEKLRKLPPLEKPNFIIRPYWIWLRMLVVRIKNKICSLLGAN